MAYLAIGLALAGFLIGLRFRLVGLLQALALVLLLTIGTCIGLGYGFTRTIVVVFAAQAAIQVGYFSACSRRRCTSPVELEWCFRPAPVFTNVVRCQGQLR